MFFLSFFIKDTAFNFLLEKYFNSGYIICIWSKEGGENTFSLLIFSLIRFFSYYFRLLIKINIKEFKFIKKSFTGLINFFF